MGEDETVLRVHANLLAEVSQCFESAIEEQLVDDSEEMSIHLSEVEPDIFERFILWLYTKDITRCVEAANRDFDKGCMQLAHLYDLAIRFLIPTLATDIVNRFAVFAQAPARLPPVELVAFIEDNTTPSAAIRRVLDNWMSRAV